MFQVIATNPETGLEVFFPPDIVMQREPYSSRRAMEFDHLQHFKRMLKVQHPDFYFRLEGDGSEPPDFFISRAGKRCGLELTVFAQPVRRERAAFFAKLQDRLIEAYDQGSLRRLEGIKIDLAFRDLGEKPVPVSESELAELIQQLEAISDTVRAPLPPNWVSSAELHPAFASGQVNDGILKWNVSSISNMPMRGSKLANHTGFEIEYTHREWMQAEDVQSALERCIQAKDKPNAGNDELLIVAGAPDRDGRAYPAEALLLGSFLAKWGGLKTEPKHINRVFVDLWGPERVQVIYSRTD